MRLDTTSIAAAGQFNESSSWSASRSASRAPGSLVALAALLCLINVDNHHDQTNRPTYSLFAKSVYESAKGMDLLGNHQQVYFSAGNDMGEAVQES
jgi:hypothetical protein